MKDIRKQIHNLIYDFVQEKRTNKSWTKGKDWVQYSGPITDHEEILASLDVLLDEWLVFGNISREFENKFAPHLGKRHGVLTSSGSSANLLMVTSCKSNRLWNIPDGSKVITPIVCFPTTLNPIYQNNLTPVFVDVELPSLNLDLDQVEDVLKQDKKREIRAIIFAHVLGNPPDMERVMYLVRKYDLIFLEDACDALGSTYDGKLLGSFGHISSCSFYPAHHMTMGEGGFVATDDGKTRKVLSSLREWGRDCYCNSTTITGLDKTACGDRFKKWLPGIPDAIYDHRYVYSEIGYNLKPTEMQAAFGLKQLEKLPSLHQARKDNFIKLKSLFEKYSEFFHLPEAQQKSDPSWFAFLLTVKENEYFTKDDFVRWLESKKIQTRSYFGGNIMAHPGYYDKIDASDKVEFINSFEVANYATRNSFFMGVYSGITEEQISYICDVVEQFFKRKLTKKLVVVGD